MVKNVQKIPKILKNSRIFEICCFFPRMFAQSKNVRGNFIRKRLSLKQHIWMKSNQKWIISPKMQADMDLFFAILKQKNFLKHKIAMYRCFVEHFLFSEQDRKKSDEVCRIITNFLQSVGFPDHPKLEENQMCDKELTL